MAPKTNWLGSRSNLELAEDVVEAQEPPPVEALETYRIYVNVAPPPPDSNKNNAKDKSKPPSEKEDPRISNKIRTSKYTMLTFLPKNLFEQFRSIANFYFLSLVILQAFPPFDNVSVGLTAAPIIFIVGVTAVKDAIEDWRRHKSDETVNKAKTYLLQGWSNRNFPGDSGSINKLPVDIKPTEEYPEFLSVDDLNGKKDQKLSSKNKSGSEQAIMESPGVNTPVWRLSKWEDVRVGDFVLLRNNDPIPADVVIISTSEPDCICYVETKNLDGETNLKIRRGINQFANVKTAKDCENSIIPIALYISIDISKTIQSILINLDEDMYDEESDKSATPRAWNLCDDLGQIEYIFSDKTGTLTCNVMEFRKCSINGVMYGNAFVTEATVGAAERGNVKIDKEGMEASQRKAMNLMKENMAKLFDTRYISENLSFIDPTLPEHLMENTDQARKIREFFSLLSVCHTVLVERPDSKNPDHIVYKAQSPDEAALVAAARDVGFTFLKRTDNVIDINIMGEIRSYTVLNVIEFNSDRKRMSVIIRRPEGQIVLLVKGADSIIFERLRRSNESDGQSPTKELEDITSKHLELFANDGLRTLCLAYKVIPPDEYEYWSMKYQAAQNAIEDREKKIDKVAELIEKDLTLMGATAIEDKLQTGVPETIETLAKAGIKIWVLTGDKMETAINIGFAANLLKRSMTLIVIKSNALRATYEQLVEALEKFWTLDGRRRRSGHLALVIDGISLKYALSPKCKPLLLELGCRCKAVVCCRVSPLQKAKVVSLVRKGLGAVSLAIGDGANDVSMIQEADIGIGISGKEGLQAVMASDYAISQFQYLAKLLLVHGRYGSPDPRGYTGDKNAMGTLLAFSCIIIVNLHNGINTSYWPWITFFGIIASLVIWVVYVLIYSSSIEVPTYGQINVLFKEPQFYLGVLWSVVVALFPRIFIKFILQYFVPSDTDIIAEVQKYMWKNGEVLQTDLEKSGMLTEDLPEEEPFVDDTLPQRQLKRVSSDHEINAVRKSIADVSTVTVLKRCNSETSVIPQTKRISTPSDEKIDNRISTVEMPIRQSLRVSPPSPAEEVKENPDGFVPSADWLRRQSIGTRPDIHPQEGKELARKSVGGRIEPTSSVLQPFATIGKRATEIFKKVPGKLRIPGTTKADERKLSSSIIFMGTHEELPNTGFCFSHEGGMSDLITPTSPKSCLNMESPEHPTIDEGVE
ncbi:hypothetical protein HDU76_007058 [Blyttiomyces sp. JEL0837]|nr:hypothetical protein HDU76_007058 [Blyttiomyces sp. JEL0837]